MSALTEAEINALRSLAWRRPGTIAPFLNIADAQRLTELGLAQRTQQGWEITPAGAARAGTGGDEGTDDILQFKRQDDPGG